LELTQVQAHLKLGRQLQDQLQNLQSSYSLPRTSDRNTAIGVVEGRDMPFYADSKINDRDIYKNYTDFDKVAVPCYNFLGDISLPMRLTPDLNLYHPKEPGFTRGKEKCAERKIINEIIRVVGKNNLERDSYSVNIYTDKEPCMYCLSLLKVQLPMLYSKLNVQIYFEQQLNDMQNTPEVFSPEYQFK